MNMACLVPKGEYFHKLNCAHKESVAYLATRVVTSYNELVLNGRPCGNGRDCGFLMNGQNINHTDSSDINNNYGNNEQSDDADNNQTDKQTTSNENNDTNGAGHYERDNEQDNGGGSNPNNNNSNDQNGNNDHGDDKSENESHGHLEEENIDDEEKENSEEESMVNGVLQTSVDDTNNVNKVNVSIPSIVFSTPYDSIEAERRHDRDIRSYNSLEEFSGTESMEYTNYGDHPTVDYPESENNLSAVICLEEGLADDDSWVEELDHDFPEEVSDNEDNCRIEERYYSRDIDLTLHTIFEESGEENVGDEEEQEQEATPNELEKYFVFELGSPVNSRNEMDGVSDSSSIISEVIELPPSFQAAAKPEPDPDAPSRLQKYFLSGFMGFSKRDSDGSVGSDSEGTRSPEQRRKKVVRARGANRHNSYDNLTNGEQVEVGGQNESSEAVTNTEEHLFEKTDGQFDTVKRTKKKKRSFNLETSESVEHEPEIVVSDEKPPSVDLVISKEAAFMSPSAIKNFLPAHGLSRKDSFNNWSSDEETNLMMSKMRAFFKNMFAQRTADNPMTPPPTNRSKPVELVYFESELTRLMKTVPGLKDEQVKEIVEYLSSEETWSDSYDSSDYASSDLDVGSQKNPLHSISVENCKVLDMQVEDKKESDLVYHCFVSSFRRIDANSDTLCNSSALMNKVMQHIGTKLVALMHEVSEGTTCTPKVSRYQRRLHKLPTITTTTTEEEDDSTEERSPLSRSKSYDPLLEESRQEASDNERFSWRGSFESALMTGSDSRTRLPSAGENSVLALATAAAKRRSAGDLLFNSANSRDHLDRVRSCSSMGGSIEDKIWSMRQTHRRRSSIPEAASISGGESADGENDTDEEEEEQQEQNLMGKTVNENDNGAGMSTTLPRITQALTGSTTNSLPRLPSSPSANIYKTNNTHFSVKSARYRPPGYNFREAAGSYHTMCAPPRREYSRRKQNRHSVSSVTALHVAVGSSDDCSVSSDVSEKTVIVLDNESGKSHSKISTVNVTRSDSMASVYSGAGEGRYGIVPVCGEVEFSLQYNYKMGDIEIHVKRCSDLAPVDVKRNRSDPYVKVYLLPDKSKSGKRKTRVKKHTLNPVFDEVLKYHMSLEQLESRTLWLSVWHSDIFGRNDFLGEVVIALRNKIFDDPMPKVYILKERSEILDNVSSFRGELIVALKFLVSASAVTKMKKRGLETGSLHVLVKEAKNLVAAKSNGSSDPFCKCYLLPNKGRSYKQKTSILKRTCNPVWNHTFAYNNVTLQELSERCIELTVWDHDRLASNEFLGGVRLSLGNGFHNNKLVDWMDSNIREMTLWQKMIDHPNFWVESSLILRPSLDVRDNRI